MCARCIRFMSDIDYKGNKKSKNRLKIRSGLRGSSLWLDTLMDSRNDAARIISHLFPN